MALKTHPFSLLDALYQYDLSASHRLLSDSRVDLPTQIEEEALRFHNGRMQDIGFVPPGEAAVLFSRPAIHRPLRRPQKPAVLGQKENCLLDGAAAKASDLLEVWSITDLFRHGFGATLGLQQEARQSLDKPQFRAWYDLAETNQSDEPGDRLERAFVTALLGRHSLCSGFNPAYAEEVKAFACLADIDAAHVRLKKLVARICR